MKDTLETINRMQANGVIGEYAIGGAVGATLYLEPAATLDVDVFVILPAQSNAIVSLSPIYEYLSGMGCKVEGAHIVIGGWPVQFLTPANELEAEAVAEAIETEVEGIRTRVMTSEHLVAIALRTGRAKDHVRILQFIEQDAIDGVKLERILARHALTSEWDGFRKRFLDV